MEAASVLLLAAWAAGVAGGSVQEARRSEPAPEERDRAAWSRLDAAERKEACEYLRLECSNLGTFQQGLVRYAGGLLEQNAELLPEPDPVRWFDPATHAPAQPIPRRVLDATSGEVRALNKRVFERVPTSRLDRGFVYDWSSRTLRRRAEWKDPERVFTNALRGFSPDLDLAIALVERALDDGAEQKALTAFAHSYTDRAGGVYPGVTLYDAWASGAEIEMPDVDTLGIVHDVLNDWKRWVAPVTRQEPLYDTIGDLFQRAHHHMGLRRALAACWADGDAVLRDGYQGALDNLHTLWEAHSSEPKALVEKLPKAKDWSAFLEGWAKTCHEQRELYQRGVHRHATLASDARLVQATARRVLTEFGAYARLDEPAKEPAPAPR
ncbi:MAG: hypothetical protein HZA53_03355 [Planctomycetes bacterium]|nr:hypothetical protein [Planctomycetota bacterium]